MSITATVEGKRVYLTGDTYPAKDRIKEAGGRWDADRKAWWVPSREVADTIIGATAQPAPERGPFDGGTGDSVVVAGSAKHGLSRCYIVGRVQRGRTQWDDRVVPVESRGGQILLVSRDGARQWWTDRANVSEISYYQKPKTIGSLRRFAEQAKANGGVHPNACPQCGSTSCERARNRSALCEQD